MPAWCDDDHGRAGRPALFQPATLRDPATRASIADRIESVTPGSRRRWGRMSAPQMLCHLTDSYQAVIGERAVSTARWPLPRALLTWVVLEAPFPWPGNVPTRPELAQGAGGTPPADFEEDRRRLLEALARFCAATPSARGPHPVLGPLTHHQWMRWGYLHADHHLRQFGT